MLILGVTRMETIQAECPDNPDTEARTVATSPMRTSGSLASRVPEALSHWLAGRARRSGMVRS